MSTTNLHYTEPVICTTNPQVWYIFFTFLHNNEWHERKLSGGINRIKDLAERQKEAEAYAAARLEWLKAGWNPIIDPKFAKKKIIRAKQMYTLNEAINIGLSKKSLAKKSKQDYENMLEFIKEVSEENGYAYLNVAGLDRGIVLELMDDCSAKRKFSNHAYNKYLGCLRAIFTELVQYRIIDTNYLLNTRSKPVPESNKYAAFTPEEKVRISNFLLKKHYGLYVVMQMIYHTGIRPKEALALKIENIDLAERIITIAADKERENSKTDALRKVPINDHLYVLLKEMEIEQYPGQYFLFGSPFQPGGGNRGSRIENGKKVTGAMRSDYFTPSPYGVKKRHCYQTMENANN
ncbi:site-specific integrase [Paraflavitalea speifideaquila]|uniref:tyrosine-type recombinase/integrase n=1 Tax=Paraflavitalea speifideaquila TaxID=3076558 RepID=UPI0028E87941|nr:site-specific integrase [Paraflavitalea speifideiaquila]